MPERPPQIPSIETAPKKEKTTDEIIGEAVQRAEVRVDGWLPKAGGSEVKEESVTVRLSPEAELQDAKAILSKRLGGPVDDVLEKKGAREMAVVFPVRKGIPVQQEEMTQKTVSPDAAHFIYYARSRRDWREITERGSDPKHLLVEFSLPIVQARSLGKLILDNPEVMRLVAERLIKENKLVDPQAWDEGVDGKEPVRPPYEEWDDDLRGEKIYLDLDPEKATHGFEERKLHIVQIPKERIQPRARPVIERVPLSASEVARRTENVWKQAKQAGDWYEKKFDAEAKRRIDEDVAVLVNDLEFVTVIGKADGSPSDFNFYRVWSHDPAFVIDKDFERRMRRTLPRPTGFPRFQQALRKEIRPLIILDDPDDASKQIIRYAVKTRARDAASRETDGGAELIFSLPKKNPLLERVKQGKMDPRELVSAALHAGAVLNEKVTHLIPLFEAGEERVVVADYDKRQLIDYEKGKATGTVEAPETPTDFSEAIRRTMGGEYFLDQCLPIDTSDIVTSDHHLDLKRYLETGRRT